MRLAPPWSPLGSTSISLTCVPQTEFLGVLCPGHAPTQDFINSYAKQQRSTNLSHSCGTVVSFNPCTSMQLKHICTATGRRVSFLGPEFTCVKCFPCATICSQLTLTTALCNPRHCFSHLTHGETEAQSHEKTCFRKG